MISYKCGAADEDLETCFPSSRIDFSRLNLFSPVWILYFPFGCILFLARLICIVVASLCAKHFHKDEYVNVFASNNYSWINGLRSEVRAVFTVWPV